MKHLCKLRRSYYTTPQQTPLGLTCPYSGKTNRHALPVRPHHPLSILVVLILKFGREWGASVTNLVPSVVPSGAWRYFHRDDAKSSLYLLNPLQRQPRARENRMPAPEPVADRPRPCAAVQGPDLASASKGVDADEEFRPRRD